jgi:hypothetical protein
MNHNKQTVLELGQQYYRNLPAPGSGGNTFTGWTISGAINTTGNGVYITTVTATSITLVGTGN